MLQRAAAAGAKMLAFGNHAVRAFLQNLNQFSRQAMLAALAYLGLNFIPRDGEGDKQAFILKFGNPVAFGPEPFNGYFNFLRHGWPQSGIRYCPWDR